ncbi:MAG: hypothetical protein AAF039_01455 [Bacteroidota bacterium]
MKRFFSMLAIAGFIAVSNCSRIPENNDPVLGIWVKAELLDGDASKNTAIPISEEWIFNDVFLGRYHRYSDNEVVFYTDFRWEVVDDVYTISYSGEDIPQVQVSLKNELLELENGDVFATRK